MNVLKKHGKKFSIFMIIGGLKAVYSVVVSWLLIDIANLPALLGSTLMVLSAFFLVYLSYRKTNVIKPGLLKYSASSIGFNIASIGFIWFLVDFLGWSGASSSALVVCGLFLARYIFFNKMKLINHG